MTATTSLPPAKRKHQLLAAAFGLVRPQVACQTCQSSSCRFPLDLLALQVQLAHQAQLVLQVLQVLLAVVMVVV